jgi:hypothetical protein
MVDIMASTRELFALINSWGFREVLGPQSFIHPSMHAYIHISIHDQNYFYTLDILIHLFESVEEEFPKGQKKSSESCGAIPISTKSFRKKV